MPITALVLGGAQCLYDDIAAAERLFKPTFIVAVKDIGITHPHVDYWVTFHLDRIPRELEQRRKLGHPDPTCFWTYSNIHTPKGLMLPVERLKITGGSSGLLGAFVGMRVAEKVVLAGIPLDPDMPHYHKRKHGKPWKEGAVFRQHWQKAHDDLKFKVRSMSGWTRQLLGKPTRDWLGTTDVE